MTCTGLRYGRENWDEVGVVGCSSRGRSTCRTHTAARSQLPPLAGADAERCQAASSGSPRMCTVFSVHGCLGHRLGHRHAVTVSSAATGFCGCMSQPDMLICTGAASSGCLGQRSLDRDRSIVAPSRAGRPQLPPLAPAHLLRPYIHASQAASAAGRPDLASPQAGAGPPTPCSCSEVQRRLREV
jgi:hypothetical protein